MIKDIILIANFCDDLKGNANNRFVYLAEILAKNNSVELITSDFHHTKRTKIKNTADTYHFKITLIHEPGYKSNVSLKRLYSHYVFSRNVLKYLKARSVPDLIYCAVPPLAVAKVAAKFAKNVGIKFFIDIQDLWPEAFLMAYNNPASRILFSPLKRVADYVYVSADGIVTVSDTYKERALLVNKKNPKALSVYLGTELSAFDAMKSQDMITKKPEDEFWIGYIGTLGHSYDIKTVINALSLLSHKNGKQLKFIVMGDGPLKNEFEEYALQKNIDVKFTGRLDYSKMVGMLCICDIAVNPIKKGSAASIINKHGDYAMAGLPVINIQENEEYRKLISEFNCGINCEAGNASEVAAAIELLYNNKELIESMGKQSRLLGETRFNREVTYKEIEKSILTVCNY